MVRNFLPANMPPRKVPAHIDEDRLLGGLNLAASLAAGKPVLQRGVLAENHGGTLLLSPAGRLPAQMIAHILQAMDWQELVLERDGISTRMPACFGVIAIDESLEDEEAIAPGLADRLAFWLDLNSVHRPGFKQHIFTAADIVKARALLPEVHISDEWVEAVTRAAAAMGILSFRPVLQTLTVARCLAALADETEVLEAEAALATQLVLSPRAIVLPWQEEAVVESASFDAPEDPLQPPDALENRHENGPVEKQPSPQSPEDMVLHAARSAIPAGLLSRLQTKSAENRIRAPSGKGAGTLRKSLHRGRPAGIWHGVLGGGARLSVIGTLHAAAPWQAIRLREDKVSGTRKIYIQKDDFRIVRYKRRHERTAIFTVDASGSQAIARLAEVKGAVELLLNECYIRRDHAALITFRGQGAELLLPPSRSLTRVKKCLAAMPGGGGTPLAKGLAEAFSLAHAVKRKGQTPVIIVLTDGKTNLALDGRASRHMAEQDALRAGQSLRQAGFASLLVDTSLRGQPFAAKLAHEMAARYLVMPYAGAEALSVAARQAMDLGHG
jgi:magnesium chelatase subunit D